VGSSERHYGWGGGGGPEYKIDFEVTQALPVLPGGNCKLLTMKNAVFWDKKSSSYLTGDTLRLDTKLSRLMIRKI
jgi:hypothetical protein